MGGIVPLRLHKMHVRIPEAGKHNAALAGDRLDLPRHRQMISDPSNHAMTDQNRYVSLGRGVRRRVHLRVCNRQILCQTNRIWTEQPRKNESLGG